MQDGTYRARAVATTLFFSSKKETPGLKITFETTDGERIDHDAWLSDAAIEYTRAMLQDQLGFRGNDISIFLECDDCSKILPNVVELVIVSEEFTTNSGDVRTAHKIKYINSPSGSQVKKMTAADAGNFASRFKGMFGEPAKKLPAPNGDASDKKNPFPF